MDFFGIRPPMPKIRKFPSHQNMWGYSLSVLLVPLNLGSPLRDQLLQAPSLQVQLLQVPSEWVAGLRVPLHRVPLRRDQLRRVPLLQVPLLRVLTSLGLQLVPHRRPRNLLLRDCLVL